MEHENSWHNREKNPATGEFLFSIKSLFQSKCCVHENAFRKTAFGPVLDLCEAASKQELPCSSPVNSEEVWDPHPWRNKHQTNCRQACTQRAFTDSLLVGLCAGCLGYVATRTAQPSSSHGGSQPAWQGRQTRPRVIPIRVRRGENWKSQQMERGREATALSLQPPWSYRNSPSPPQ